MKNFNRHFDLNNFYFVSRAHVRFEHGTQVVPMQYCNRGIEIVATDEFENCTEKGGGFYVTIYNLDGIHPVWRNNIQMASKCMRVIEESPDKIVLRGVGYDARAGRIPDASFANYGATLHIKNGNVEFITMHMHDRHVDIHYF